MLIRCWTIRSTWPLTSRLQNPLAVAWRTAGIGGLGVGILALSTMLLVALPVLVARHLPLLDAPGHESRLAALRDLLLTGRGSAFYAIKSYFVPNIGFDTIGLALVGFFGPETTGRLFLLLTLLLTLGGTLLLNRVSTQRWSLLPLAAGIFLYNLVTILGFFSFSFGLALVPWALSLRLVLAGKGAVWPHVAGAAVAVLLLFCHVFDFAVYAIMSGGFILEGLWTRRLRVSDTARCALEYLPALAVFFVMTASADGSAEFPSHFAAAKMLSLAKSMTSGSMVADAAFVAGIAALSGLMLFCAPMRRIVPSFIPGIVILALLYLVMPEKLGSGAYVDTRMPIVLALMLAAGLDVRFSRSSLAIGLAGVFAIALVTKQAAIAVLWRSFDPLIDQLATNLDKLPPGAVIMQQECEPNAADIPAIYRERQPSLTHLAAMAAFDNSRFAANTWAIPGQQTVRVKNAYRPFYDLQAAFGSSDCSSAGQAAGFRQIERLLKTQKAAGALVPPTYYLLIRPPHPAALADAARLLARNPQYELYQVEAE